MMSVLSRLLLLLQLLLPSLLPLTMTSAFVLEGSKTSYAQFPRWEGTADSSLSFEFRTSQPSGLLLYTEQADSCHFLQLSLVSGRLQLRLNAGHGSQVLVVATPGTEGLSDGRWHQVTVQREGANTSLQVDDIITDEVVCHDQELRSHKLGKWSHLTPRSHLSLCRQRVQQQLRVRGRAAILVLQQAQGRTRPTFTFLSLKINIGYLPVLSC